MPTVKKWAVIFKGGRTSLESEPREGWPITTITTRNHKKVHDIVSDDRRKTVREIDGGVEIFEGTSCTKGKKGHETSCTKN
ncbi:hypothetical protein TNIN_498591 [Trichonephila inaurata madagascariensis]|uniref:Uncharacterized protein n=1 Tax=Trichonephila inaurata madagascariensis TaxID=2747483 RepID=A0A8X6YXI0_9ARAC|nr:hypothetical protein TNIN_498591 [Trichonephila inaurata madagascariensis]